MKTFYFYGKLTREAYHIKVLLLNEAPPGYYYLMCLNAVNKVTAWWNFITFSDWKKPDYNPPKPSNN